MFIIRLIISRKTWTLKQNKCHNYLFRTINCRFDDTLSCKVSDFCDSCICQTYSHLCKYNDCILARHIWTTVLHSSQWNLCLRNICRRNKLFLAHCILVSRIKLIQNTMFRSQISGCYFNYSSKYISSVTTSSIDIWNPDPHCIANISYGIFSIRCIQNF